jgi:hypothetical protein
VDRLPSAQQRRIPAAGTPDEAAPIVLCRRISPSANASFALERQSAQAEFSAYRENSRWQTGEVLFVTLNLPGSNNNHDATGSQRIPRSQPGNTAWLAQSFALARRSAAAGILIVIQGNPGFQAANAGRPQRDTASFSISCDGNH